MTLLRVVTGDTGPYLRGERITLRPPALSDYPQWAALREASRDFLRPWEPTWPIDDLTRAAYKRRIKRYAREARDDLGYPFFVFSASDDRLLGGLTLSNVRRGVSQSCSMGYWMGLPFAGLGVMGEAVRLAVPHAFDTLRLHRIEAASMPDNDRSIRLLERAGFTREGYARRYILINGAWRDHVLFAMAADDPRPVAVLRVTGAPRRLDAV